MSQLTRSQERSFASAAGTAPAQGKDASLPEISENHRGPTGAIEVGASKDVLRAWAMSFTQLLLVKSVSRM